MGDFLARKMETTLQPAAVTGLQNGAAALGPAPERRDEPNLKSISGHSYCISILFAEMGCWERSGGRERDVNSLNEALHSQAQREVKQPAADQSPL